MTFQAHAVCRDAFTPLFDLPDEALATHRAVRVTVDSNPGYPDRVSMRDAELGETLILVNFEHQAADSPYRARHAIYVSPTAEPATLQPGELPPYFMGRVIALRAFDEAGMIVGAELVEGAQARPAIEGLLADPTAAYLHAHFAKYGCFAARIERA